MPGHITGGIHESTGGAGTPDEPYLARPDQPYEPPPDQPYQLPLDQPHQLPLDQAHDEPPPDQPHEPLDQPHDEPPPDAPEILRRSRQWLIIGAAVIALAVALAVEVILASIPAPAGSSSSDPDRYGQSAVDVVHELHICDNPQVDNGFVTCMLPDGIGYAIVATVGDKAEHDEFASGANDHGMGCTMVVKGYLVTGPDRDTLTQALGDLDAFASKHHGHLGGDCS